MKNSKLSNKILFFAFQQISLSAFGGALPWARVILVDKKKYISEDDFSEALALSQFTPGATVLNLALIIGFKNNGVIGSFFAFLGLMLIPFLICCLVGMQYTHLAQLDSLSGVFEGICSVSAGIFISLIIKLLINLFNKKPLCLFITLVSFVFIAFLKFHILIALVLLVPLGMLIAKGDVNE